MTNSDTPTPGPRPSWQEILDATGHPLDGDSLALPNSPVSDESPVSAEAIAELSARLADWDRALARAMAGDVPVPAGLAQRLPSQLAPTVQRVPTNPELVPDGPLVPMEQRNVSSGSNLPPQLESLIPRGPRQESTEVAPGPTAPRAVPPRRPGLRRYVLPLTLAVVMGSLWAIQGYLTPAPVSADRVAEQLTGWLQSDRPQDWHDWQPLVTRRIPVPRSLPGQPVAWRPCDRTPFPSRTLDGFRWEFPQGRAPEAYVFLFRAKPDASIPRDFVPKPVRDYPWAIWICGNPHTRQIWILAYGGDAREVQPLLGPIQMAGVPSWSRMTVANTHQ